MPSRRQPRRRTQTHWVLGEADLHVHVLGGRLHVPVVGVVQRRRRPGREHPGPLRDERGVDGGAGVREPDHSGVCDDVSSSSANLRPYREPGHGWGHSGTAVSRTPTPALQHAGAHTSPAPSASARATARGGSATRATTATTCAAPPDSCATSAPPPPHAAAALAPPSASPNRAVDQFSSVDATTTRAARKMPTIRRRLDLCKSAATSARARPACRRRRRQGRRRHLDGVSAARARRRLHRARQDVPGIGVQQRRRELHGDRGR